MTARNALPRPPGKPASRSRLRRFMVRWGWLLPVGAVILGAGLLMLTYAFASIPLPSDIQPDASAEVYDLDGRLIGTYSGEERRFLINTARLIDQKPYIGQAIVAAEDRDFFDHSGVSLRAIVRAAWANLTGGEISQGGSTITQQYVKIAVLEDPSRTISRKAKEAILAIKLERRFSKEQILGFYMNTIYLGRGAYGIEAAARTYFNKHAHELTLGEAAYLAGIIPAPESYQPDENPRGAQERRDRVLDVMVDEGYVGAAEAAEAKTERLKIAKGGDASAPTDQRAAYFMEWLRKQYLYPEYGNDLYTAGLKIYTTLDLRMQGHAETAVATTLTEPGDPQAALVAMTPSGAVRAFVGGRRFTNVRSARGFNYATDFPGRQPGSSFKPFTLLTAIEQDISPRSRFAGHSPMHIDEPVCYTNGEPWEVENYGGSSYGTIDLVQATASSVNTVYAQLVAEVGPDALAETLDRFGFAPKYGDDEIVANCSNALGGSLDVTPLEMARAYAGLAGRGALPDAMPIRYITSRDGECLKAYRPVDVRCDDETSPGRRRVVEQNSADVLTDVLTHVVTEGTAASAIDLGRPAAGKTGTTQDNRDAWFGGYVPQLTAVVWMGYPLDRKLGRSPLMQYCADPRLCRPVHGIEVTGGSFPATIWGRFMAAAVADMPVRDFPTPEEIPDEVINSPPPAPPSTPEPVETEEEPSPTPEPEPTPTFTPEPTPEPTPSEEPTVVPTEGGGEP